MTDDGNLSNADEIAGDGVFSVRAFFHSASKQPIELQIELQQTTPYFIAKSSFYPFSPT